jgi:hypothetical protein
MLISSKPAKRAAFYFPLPLIGMAVIVRLLVPAMRLCPQSHNY